MSLDYQLPTKVTALLPIGVNRIKLPAKNVGAPPGAESYLTCGVNVALVLVLTIPRMTTVMFSVADTLAPVTATAVAAVAYILLTAPKVLPVVLVVSAVYVIPVSAAPNANNVLKLCEFDPTDRVM